MSKRTARKSQPVLVIGSVIAGAQMLLSYAGLTDFITKQQLGLATAIVAAASVGLAFYVRGQVVPYEDVSSYRDKTGEVVSGPVAPPEGVPVDVVPQGDGAEPDDLTPREIIDPLYGP